MTKIYSELFENADPNKALNSYKTNGAFVLKNVFNKIEINKLRNNLDTLFSNDGDQRIRNLKESNTKDLEFYLNYFYNQNLLNFFNQVFNKNNNNKNYLLPPMHFAKNYLPHSKFTRIGGWHRDCGGELNYSECRRLIQNDNYYFGKVGIYCQDNGEYGGGIDIIPKSNNDYIKNSYGLSRGTIGVKTLRIAQLISKSFHKILSRSKLYHLIFGIEKLNINQGDVVFFDARIWHKGSYAFSNIEKNLDYDHSKLQANIPKSFKKYVLYSHFGNYLGMKSYLTDRDRRSSKNNLKESMNWRDELDLVYSNALLKNCKNYKYELEELINRIVN